MDASSSVTILLLIFPPLRIALRGSLLDIGWSEQFENKFSAVIETILNVTIERANSLFSSQKYVCLETSRQVHHTEKENPE